MFKTDQSFQVVSFHIKSKLKGNRIAARAKEAPDVILAQPKESPHVPFGICNQ